MYKKREENGIMQLHVCRINVIFFVSKCLKSTSEVQMTKVRCHWLINVKLNSFVISFSHLLSFRCWHRLLMRALVQSSSGNACWKWEEDGCGFAQIDMLWHFFFNKDLKWSFVCPRCFVLSLKELPGSRLKCTDCTELTEYGNGL